MAPASKPRITVEFQLGTDPIRGSTEDAGGRRQPFWGWLELIEALRRVAANEPELEAQASLGNTSGRPRAPIDSGGSK